MRDGITDMMIEQEAEQRLASDYLLAGDALPSNPRYLLWMLYAGNMKFQKYKRIILTGLKARQANTAK